jgi:hypothetical protein
VIKKKSKLFKSKQIAEHIKFAVHLNRDLAWSVANVKLTLPMTWMQTLFS